jgi:MFS family permease
MRQNRNTLLSINVIDMMGLFIILPILPELMDYYLKLAHPMDGWLLYLEGALRSALPAGGDSAVLAGGLAASVFSFFQFLSSPLLGALSDKIGRKPVIVAGSIGFVAAAGLWYYSDSFTLFFLSRVIGGVAGGTAAVGAAAIADISTDENRTKNVALLGASFGVGSILGPMLAAFLMQIHWTPPGSVHPFTICALASAFIGFTSVPVSIFLLSEPDRHISSSALSAFQTARAIPFFITITVVNLVFSIVYTGMEFFIPFYFRIDFALSPAGIGLTFLYLGVIVVAGQALLVPILAKRMSEKRIAQAGLLVVPVPLVLFASAAPNLALAFLCLLPLALGIAMIFAGMNALATSMAPRESRGAAIGFFQAFFPLGSGFGPLLTGSLYWSSGIVVTCMVLGSSFLFLAALLSRVPGRAPNADDR